MTSFKKLWNEFGITPIIILIAVAFVVNMFANYLYTKGKSGPEFMTQTQNNAYYNGNQKQGQSNVPKPAEDLGQNEVFASVNGMSTPTQGVPTSCSSSNIQNPADLFPANDKNSWAQLNPQGKGELANINLLKAGYHYGIDTVGSSLRNANLQIRSEPPNPQVQVGPWNNTTITPDFMRIPLELGGTSQ
jgi:hypothetical protein